MGERFTPAEKIQAKHRAKEVDEHNREARIQGRFYRVFLENLRQNVQSELELQPSSNPDAQLWSLLPSGEDGLEEMTKKSLMQAIDSDDLKIIGKEKLINIAADFEFQPGVIGEMKPKEFFEYLDRLEKTLAK